MTDRELLERAARAAGLYYDENVEKEQPNGGWNPLKEDGDAFRLMAKLNLNLGFDAVDSGVEVAVMGVWDGGPDTVCEVFDGPDAAPSMRRAIVRAAAAMGVDDG